MSKFIYVFNTDARDAMINAGYIMLKSDDRNNIFVFEGVESPNQTQTFALNNVSYIPSNTLTF